MLHQALSDLLKDNVIHRANSREVNVRNINLHECPDSCFRRCAFCHLQDLDNLLSILKLWEISIPIYFQGYGKTDATDYDSDDLVYHSPTHFNLVINGYCPRFDSMWERENDLILWYNRIWGAYTLNPKQIMQEVMEDNRIARLLESSTLPQVLQTLIFCYLFLQM